jgi:hypothetical protein
MWPYVAAGGVVVLAVLVLLLWRPVRAILREVRTEKARELFHLQRERLEFKFFDLAAGSGKPRGLRWVDADWEDAVTYVRDRKTGEISALVGITVRFEAIEGGGMEDNPNVSNLRDATAVFHFQRGHWMTAGRVLFNMNPNGALSRYHDQFEQVPSPEGSR